MTCVCCGAETSETMFDRPMCEDCANDAIGRSFDPRLAGIFRGELGQAIGLLTRYNAWDGYVNLSRDNGKFVLVFDVPGQKFRKIVVLRQYLEEERNA